MVNGRAQNGQIQARAATDPQEDQAVIAIQPVDRMGGPYAFVPAFNARPKFLRRYVYTRMLDVL